MRLRTQTDSTADLRIPLVMILLLFGCAAPARIVPEPTPQNGETIDIRAIAPVASFDHAVAMDVDPNGAVYVVDGGRNTVTRITDDSTSAWGGIGSDKQSFDEPSGISATNGLRVLVADRGNSRIQWFTESGVYVGSVQLDGARVGGLRDAVPGHPEPTALASDSENELFVLDDQNRSVLHWRRDRPIEVLVDGRSFRDPSIGNPVAIAVDGERMFVGDRASGNVLVFDRLGTFERTLCSSQCGGLSSIAIAGDRLVVATDKSIRTYFPHGLLDAVLPVKSNSRLVAAIPSASDWILLTEKALYRIRR